VLNGAGGRGESAVGGDEGGGDVFEEEREAEVVGDADGDEGVEIVLCGVSADDDGVGFEDGVGGEDIDASDADIGGGMGGEVEEEEAGDAEDKESENDGNGEVSALGLREGEIGHGLRIAVWRRGGERLDEVSGGDIAAGRAGVMDGCDGREPRFLSGGREIFALREEARTRPRRTTPRRTPANRPRKKLNRSLRFARDNRSWVG
jgi:hypothetical protein